MLRRRLRLHAQAPAHLLPQPRRWDWQAHGDQLSQRNQSSGYSWGGWPRLSVGLRLSAALRTPLLSFACCEHNTGPGSDGPLQQQRQAANPLREAQRQHGVSLRKQVHASVDRYNGMQESRCTSNAVTPATLGVITRVFSTRSNTCRSRTVFLGMPICAGRTSLLAKPRRQRCSARLVTDASSYQTSRMLLSSS